jgi:hypothetical protein
MLFVGAGLSFLSKNRDGEQIPDGKALVDLLLEQPIGTGSPHTLERVAGYVVRNKGTNFTYDLIKNCLTVTQVDEKLPILYDIPWRRIYTTNYDNAIEMSLAGRRPVSSLTLNDEQARVSTGAIIHINGFINEVSPATLQANLTLTDYAYATSRLQDSEWFRFFLKDLSAARAIFFVGYSLSDLDIQRALISDPSLARKTYFYVSPKADDLEKGVIADFGQLIEGGIEQLLSSITVVGANYEAVRFSTGFVALKEITAFADNGSSESNATKIKEQLVYGRLPEHEVLHSEFVFGNQPYLVSRRQDKDISAALSRGPYRDILITGELASGKTASSLNLASILIKQGYKIYYANKSLKLIEELRKLTSNRTKIAVIFENYVSMLDEIRDYASRRPIEHRIILTERSVTHDLFSDFITKTNHLGPVFETSLDRIDLIDVPQFEALVNFGGFWGDRAGASESARQRIIINQLDSSLYKLLVEVIESEKVRDEVRRLVEPLTKDPYAMKIFVSAFIVNVMNFRFSLNDWQTIYDPQRVRLVMQKYSEQVRHFIRLQGDTIFPRAGLLSVHILKNFASNELIGECLVDLYQRTTRRDNSDPELISLRIALTRYGSIEPMFSGVTKGQNIFRYYDDIRVFGDTRNNPDYWLQLGIAATVHEDLDAADSAFKNAYAREKAKLKPNLKRIDNYFSRFEMRKAIQENDPKEAFATFARASERLKKQIFLEENRHYPFKTGRYYTDIAAKHFAKWDQSQQAQFVRETGEIHQKAVDWNASSRESSVDVDILIRETSSLLKRIATSQ